MAIDILNSGTFRPTFEPIDTTLNEVVDSSLEAAVDNLYFQTEKNIGLIIAHLQVRVESKKDDEIRKALDESKALKAQAAVLTDFLKHLEGELSNTGAKKINLANQSELVAKVNELVPHKLLEKTEWTREEAEALCKIIPRHSEQLMNQINDALRDINQRVEDRHELLSIFRDLQKMYREMHEVFIRNQKV